MSSGPGQVCTSSVFSLIYLDLPITSYPPSTSSSLLTTARPFLKISSHPPLSLQHPLHPFHPHELAVLRNCLREDSTSSPSQGENYLPIAPTYAQTNSLPTVACSSCACSCPPHRIGTPRSWELTARLENLLETRLCSRLSLPRLCGVRDLDNGSSHGGLSNRIVGAQACDGPNNPRTASLFHTGALASERAPVSLPSAPISTVLRSGVFRGPAKF